ncbi:MFS transporter [Pseudorhodoplanes sinuspersici]|uniref:MFS transporter n=1 Tax=Pseudorhodoplanes sinuspersici TaxID=1235591 RepID=A0A1W6ZRT4_9HYPH|nr:MFS transporter [Pseudorhodoplanes sinuspersici]ARP99977.1 MFS transporter [Pseudorhodoplanes sinuspersici]RKE71006.1 sugar phosphate permease [Pseudorhodoplanes sinuspersici]
MTVLADTNATKRDERRAMSVASGAHALHDGYTDLIYVMLPIWQAEFALSYAAVGLLRGLFTGTMASLQIPAGHLSERYGAAAILAGGTALAGFGYCLAGLSGGFSMLLIALFVGGLGASAQHPIASALVAHAFSGPRSLKALGGYNFAGDIGKMTVPAFASLMLVAMPWRPALIILGAAGFLAALLILLLTPRFTQAITTSAPKTEVATKVPRIRHYAFPTLLSIGIIDSATRMGFLTFLPFILTAKGANLPTIGIALTLVFAGGAVGKLVCAFIGARIGVIGTVFLTEIMTLVLILLILPTSLETALIILPILGIALNGTSSVLYGSVPDLVEPEKRTRAFGIFYTGTIGAGAIAPILYGVVSDATGLTGGVIVVAALVILTLPLAFALRPAFAQLQSPSAD